MPPESTVLILGAGSSTHVGYPLGRQLISEIVRLRPESAESLPQTWSVQEVNEFITSLSHADPWSIDAFLGSREYSHQKHIGKFLIARALKSLEDVNRLFHPHDAGWYRVLFDAFCENGSLDVAQPRVKVVTFNYDRSLEAYLSRVAQSRYRLDVASADATVARLPIVHVHGSLGPLFHYAYRPFASPDELLQMSQQIQVISEIQDCENGFCNSEFQKANEYLASADRIIFLGFGFHEENVRRLRFFTPEAVAKRHVNAALHNVYGTGRSRLVEKLSSYGFKNEHFQNSTCDEFCRCVDWI